MDGEQDTHRAFAIPQGNGRWRFVGHLPPDVSPQDVQVVTITGPRGFDPRWPAEPITGEELALYQNQFTIQPYHYTLEPYRADHGARGGRIVLPRTVGGRPSRSLAYLLLLIGVAVAVAIGIAVWLTR
jgi:hypothetical protein